MALIARLAWASNTGKGVYAVLARTGSGKIMYVGLSYTNTNNEAKIKANGAPYFTAKIEIFNNGKKGRLTKTRLQDVERCLVHALQPPRNTNLKNFGPRKVLVVTSSGQKPVKIPRSISYKKKKQVKSPETKKAALALSPPKRRIKPRPKPGVKATTTSSRKCKCSGCRYCTTKYRVCTTVVRVKHKKLCARCRRKYD